MLVHRKNFQAILKKLSETGVYAIDTETTGLSVYHGDRLFSVAVYDGTEAYYFNFQYYQDIDPEVFLPREWLKDFERAFINPYTVWVMHNAKFDMTMFKAEGLEFAGMIWDTEIGARLENNTYMRYSLAECGKRIGVHKDDAVMEYIEQNKLYRLQPVAGKNEIQKFLFFNQVPLDIIAPYAEQDTRLTYELYRRQIELFKNEFEARPQANSLLVMEQECALTKVCFKMETLGVKIDTDYCTKALASEKEKIKAAETEYKFITGKDLIDSAKELEEAFKPFGIEPAKTAKANASFTDDHLAGIDHPLAACLRTYREACKRFEYFNTFLWHSDGDNVLHPNMRQSGTATGRFSYINPNCVSMDTEILTQDGWKDYYSLSKDDLIAGFSLETNRLMWEKPTTIWVSDSKAHSMVETFNQHIKIRTTSNHRTIFKDRKSGKFKITSASNFLKDSNILHGGILESEEYPIPDNFLKLVVATQADGSHTNGNQIVFVFSKNRKSVRLLEILEGLKIPYKYKIGKLHRISIQNFKSPFLKEKKFTQEVLKLSYRQRLLFAEELKYWDGSSTRKNFDYCSNHIENINIVQAVAATIGWRCHVYKHSNTKAYIASFVRKNYSGTSNIKVSEEVKDERVWCVKVPSSFFVARRKGDTFITGNCQNLPKKEPNQEFPVRRAIVPRDGYFFVFLDYDQMEYRLMLDYAGAMSLINKVKGGLDVHQATADDVGLTRDEAKTTNFAILYGSGIAKLAKNLKKTFDQAKRIKYAVLNSAPEVGSFIRRVSDAVKQREDHSIINWLGRRYRYNDLNFAYKAPNHLIQGGCADIMKKAMVEVDRFLADKKSRLLLQVHDELILEVAYGEEHIVPELKSIVENAYTSKLLPLTCGVEYSKKSWFDKSETLDVA